MWFCIELVSFPFLPDLRTKDNHRCRQAEEQNMYFFLNDTSHSPFITYQRILSNSKTMCVTSGTGTALPSGFHEFTFVICEVRVVKFLVLYVAFVSTIYFLLVLSFELWLLVKAWYL